MVDSDFVQKMSTAVGINLISFYRFSEILFCTFYFLLFFSFSYYLFLFLVGLSFYFNFNSFFVLLIVRFIIL